MLRDQDVEEMEEQLATVKIGDAVYAVGELVGSAGFNRPTVGLKCALVAQKLREAFLPDRVAGRILTRPTFLPSELPRGSFGAYSGSSADAPILGRA